MTDLIAQLEEQLANFPATSETGDCAVERIKLLNALSRELSFTNPRRAVDLAAEAHRLAKENGVSQADRFEEAASLFNLARANNQLGNYTDSLAYLLEAQACYESLADDAGLMWVYNELGRTHFFLSDYPNALSCYLKGLELADRLEHTNRQAGLRHNIAMVYSSIGEYEQALEMEIAGQRIAEQAGDTWTQAFLLGGLAEAHFHLNHYSLALEYGKRAIELAQAAHLYSLAHGTLLVLSWANFELGNLEIAQATVEEARQSAFGAADKRGLGEALRAQGEQVLRLHQPARAIPLLLEALALAEELGEKLFIGNCCKALSQAYAQTGDFKLAFEAHQRYHDLEKAVFNEKSDSRLKALAVLHRLENARKETEIYQLRNITLQKEIEERTKAQEALQFLARHDSLTGLLNRRFFFERGEELLRPAAEADQPVSSSVALIMLDLDHFKLINDRYGHQVGDSVLVTLSRIIQEHVREQDLVCRYGGEEVVMLLPGADEQQAGEIAERVRQAVASQAISSPQGYFSVTISLGVSACEGGQSVTLDRLLYAADQALYAAKHAGRNCVILSSIIQQQGY